MPILTELKVKISADISGFNKSIDKVSSKMKDMGDSMGRVGAQMSARVTLPILAAGAAAIKVASDAEEMKAKFDTVFKTVGGTVTVELDKFGSAVGRSRFELMGMAAQLGDTLKPLGFTEEAAGTTSVTLTKLATDLSSFNNMSMDEALTRLRGTLVGAHENALGFGVVINENTLKAEMARQGTDKLKGAMFEQAKVQARINLLIAGTTDAQGDALRTSGSFANKLRGLQASLTDVGIVIGNHLLPVATGLVNKIGDIVRKIEGADPRIIKLGISLAAVAAAIGPLLLIGGKMMTLLGSVIKVVKLATLIMSPWLVAIAAAAAAAYLLWDNWDEVRVFLESRMMPVIRDLGRLWEQVKDIVVAVVGRVYNIVVSVFSSLQEFWGRWGNKILTTVKDIWGAMVSAISSALDLIGTVVILALDLFKTFWDNWGSDILNVLGVIFDTIGNIFTVGFQVLGGIFDIWSSIFKGDWAQAWEDYKELVQVVMDGIEKIVKEAFANMLLEMVSFAKFVPGLSHIFADLGDAAKGAGGKIEEAGDKAEPAERKSGGLKGAIDGIIQSIGSKGGGGLITGLIGISDELFNLGNNIGTGTGEGATGVIGDLERMKVRGVDAVGAVRASAFELRSVFGSSPGAGNLRGAIAGAGDDLKKGSPFESAVQDSVTALAHGGGLSGVLMTLGQSLVPGLGTAMATVGGVLGSFGVDLGGLGEALKGVFHALTFGIFASENLDMFGGEVSSTEARARERLAPLIEAAIQRGAPQWEIMSNLINSWSRLFEQSGLTFTQWKVLLTSSGVPSGAAEMPESVRRGFEFLRQFRPDLYDNGIGNIWQQPTLYTDLYAGIDTSGFSGKTAFGGSAPVVQVFLDNEMVTGLIADQLVREVITKSG